MVEQPPEPIEELGSTVAATGAAATVGGGPPGLIVGALAGWVTRVGIRRLWREHVRRQRRNATWVIAEAAFAAGRKPSELLARLETAPLGRELLAQTLRVAAEAGLTDRLLLLARSLAAAAAGTDERIVDELAFVAALRETNGARIVILVLFGRSQRELGLSLDSTDWQRRVLPTDLDAPVGRLTGHLLKLLVPAGMASTLDATLAALVSNGLLTREPALAGAYGGAGMAPHWRLTEFGGTFLERIRAVAMNVLGET